MSKRQRRIKEMSWLKRLTGVFSLVVIVAVSLIALFVWVYQPNPQMLGLELVKALLQIVTVLVLGQFVSLLIAEYNHERQRERQRLEAIADFQKEVLNRLTRS